MAAANYTKTKLVCPMAALGDDAVTSFFSGVGLVVGVN